MRLLVCSSQQILSHFLAMLTVRFLQIYVHRYHNYVNFGHNIVHLFVVRVVVLC